MIAGVVLHPAMFLGTRDMQLIVGRLALVVVVGIGLEEITAMELRMEVR